MTAKSQPKADQEVHNVKPRSRRSCQTKMLPQQPALNEEVGTQQDLEIHAFQIFSENDDLMTFEAVAGRFAEFGWKGMCAPNTIEKHVEDLVLSAELEVLEHVERFNRLASIRANHHGGVHNLADRARRHIRNMIFRSGLQQLFPDPEKIATAMGNQFVHLMTEHIPGSWTLGSDDEKIDLFDLEGFVPYVCGGLTCEQFIPAKKYVRLEPARLDLLISLMASLDFDGMKAGEIKREATSLDRLGVMFMEERELFRAVKSELNSTIVEMRKVSPNRNAAKRQVEACLNELRHIRERWCRVRGLKAIDLEKIAESFIRHASLLADDHVKTGTDLIELSQDLKQIAESAARMSSSAGNGLESLLGRLKQFAASVDIREPDQMPFMLADTIAKLESLIGMQPAPIRNSPTALKELLDALKPHESPRYCRPFELFLFAAQHNLLRNKLIRRASTLDPQLKPGSLRPLKLPILRHYRKPE